MIVQRQEHNAGIWLSLDREHHLQTWRIVIQRDFAAMQASNRFDERQAKPGTGNGARWIEPTEFL